MDGIKQSKILHAISDAAPASMASRFISVSSPYVSAYHLRFLYYSFRHGLLLEFFDICLPFMSISLICMDDQTLSNKSFNAHSTILGKLVCFVGTSIGD